MFLISPTFVGRRRLNQPFDAIERVLGDAHTAIARVTA